MMMIFSKIKLVGNGLFVAICHITFCSAFILKMLNLFLKSSVSDPHSIGSCIRIPIANVDPDPEE
jgi:hypothetical protein